MGIGKGASRGSRCSSATNKVTLFSKAEVPLVHQVIPMLETLEHQLTAVREARELPNVIRIAAQAALLVIGKYYALTDDNEVYRIAIVMCPDKKLEWFNINPDWRAEDRELVKHVVCTRWRETYAPSPPSNTTNANPSSNPRALNRSTQSRGRWTSSFQAGSSSGSGTPVNPDAIESYLGSPLVSADDLKAGGGPLVYWEQARHIRPQLAQFALDFLSAPASSVDAERAFSVGRLQVNHLQHGISSQSFKALVALGSWYNTPLMLKDLKAVSLAVENSRDRKGKGKALVAHDTIIVDD